MNRTLMCTLTFLLASCEAGGLRPAQVEAYGSRSSLQHAPGAHEIGEGVRMATVPVDYGDYTAQGILGIGASSGSNTFQGIRLDESRLVADIGVRLGRPIGPTVLYLGLGAQPERLSVRDSVGESDSAWALAGYLALGLQARLGGHVLLGLEYRATSGARFDLLDSPGVDMDERSLALSLGWSL